MNLVEKLIRIDKDKARDKETKKIKSSRLSRLLGEETEITIREISGRKSSGIAAMAIMENGKTDFSKMYDINLMYCVEGIVDPPLRDGSLMEHFGAKTPKDLVEILFGSEATEISDEIVSLSKVTPESEKEVKN